MGDRQFVGKTAIVTGGARGLGQAIALALAGRGAAVAIADVDGDNGNKVVQEIQKGGAHAIFVPCDLHKESDVKNMVQKVVSAFATIDILVNNAGVLRFGRLWEMPAEAWDDLIAVNLRGPFLCVKHVIPHMIGQKEGRVINISSGIGRQAQPLMGAYAMSKAGLIAMTVSLAKEVAEYGIRVNAVCPGPVDTTLWTQEAKRALSQVLDVPEAGVVDWFTQTKQVIKAALRPEDIAGAVCWLASGDTQMMTGQILGIDGGENFPTF